MDTRVIKQSDGTRMHRQKGNETVVEDMHGHESNKTIRWDTYA
jgi:hypothetical protein